MTRIRRWLGRRCARPAIAIVLAAVLAASAAGVALAHTSLIRSEPAPNTRLDHSPDQVAVWFDEQVEPDYAFLSVFDHAGQRVDRLDAQFVPGDQPAIKVGTPTLPAGSYVVVWRVISLDDGHAVGGAFAFGVNAPPDPAAAATAGAQADAQPDLTTFLIRYAGLLGQLILFGALAFRYFVWLPVLTRARQAGGLPDPALLEPEQRRWIQILADVLVGALITGLLGSLYVQARSTGVPFWQLLGTHWGFIWLGRAALVLLAAVWMESILDGRRAAYWRWGLSLGLLVSSTLVSHSAARPGLIGPLADLAHQLAAGAWAGGLVMLVMALLALRGSPLLPDAQRRLAAAAIARFSAMASLAVGLLLVTGLALGLQQVPSWAGLLLTPYGQVLQIKLALAAGALALGAYNSWRSAGALVSARGAWIAVEAVVVAMVVFSAAALVDLPPASTAGTSGTALANETSTLLHAQSGGWVLDTRVTPGRLGSNVFELSVSDAAGQPVVGAQATLHFEPLAGGAATDLPLAEDRPGRYSGTGAGLNQQGPWRITVRVGPPTAGAVYDVAVGLDTVVRPAGAPLPLAVEAVGWLNRFGLWLLAVLMAAAAGGWACLFVRIRRPPPGVP